MAIHVNAVNDPPEAIPLTVSMGGVPATGAILGQVLARDIDNTLLFFTITAGNGLNAVSIGLNSGEISVANSALLGGVSELVLEVEVGDGEATDMAEVRLLFMLATSSFVVRPLLIPFIKERLGRFSTLDTVRVDGLGLDSLTFRILGTERVLEIESSTGRVYVNNSQRLRLSHLTQIDLEIEAMNIFTLSDRDTISVSIPIVQPIWLGTGAYTQDIGYWNINEAPLDATDRVLVDGGILRVDRDVSVFSMDIRNMSRVEVSDNITLFMRNGIIFDTGELILQPDAVVEIENSLSKVGGAQVTVDRMRLQGAGIRLF